MAKIALDAGHGMGTAGKRCWPAFDPKETREWYLNNRVAVAAEKYLRSAGHEVIRLDDTTGKTDVPLATRTSKVNSSGAAVCVSIHHNAGIYGGSGGGTVVITHPNAVKVTESRKLARMIYNHSVARANLKGNRSEPTPQQNLWMCGKPKMPCCLIECGFMDSSVDIKYILDASWSDAMGRGIAEGICEYIGGTVKDVSAQAPVQSTPAKTTSTTNGGFDMATLKTLKQGMEGPQVESAQILLIGHGFSCGSAGADGKYGSSTYKAAVAFQKKAFPNDPKEWDGVIGQKSWAKLLGA